jgi:hypothetical protein
VSAGFACRPTPKNRSISGNPLNLSVFIQPGLNLVIIGHPNGSCSAGCFGFLINPVAFCADMGLERDKARISVF